MSTKAPVWTAACILVASCLLPAQQVKDFPEIDLPALGSRAEAALQSNPNEAIPYMVEIKGRLTNAMSEEFRTIYRENLYMLGLAHMRWYEMNQNPQHLLDGIPYWDEFIQEFLSDKRHPLAMMNRADSYFGAEKWGGALEAYLHILQIYSQQLEPGELYGLLQRLVIAAAEAERSAETVEPLQRFLDPRFSDDVRLFALNTLFDRALEAEGLDALMRLVA